MRSTDGGFRARVRRRSRLSVVWYGMVCHSPSDEIPPFALTRCSKGILSHDCRASSALACTEFALREGQKGNIPRPRGATHRPIPPWRWPSTWRARWTYVLAATLLQNLDPYLSGGEELRRSCRCLRWYFQYSLGALFVPATVLNETMLTCTPTEAMAT